MAGRGRPTVYTQEVADEVCERLAEGESLNSICRTEGFPAASVVRLWVMDDREGFAARYARARELQAEHYADELSDIADDGQNDYMQRATRNGFVPVVDHEHISRSKLRFEARQWIISKILSKKYGDRLQITGANGGPIKSLTAGAVSNDPIEAAKAYAKLMAGEGEE